MHELDIMKDFKASKLLGFALNLAFLNPH